jgi:hypothetical protein
MAHRDQSDEDSVGIAGYRHCSAPLFWADRSVLVAGIVFMV